MKNIFITGERGAGKSTLVLMALEHLAGRGAVSGFFTYAREVDGERHIFIASAQTNEERLFAKCALDRRDARFIDSTVLDGFGADQLTAKHGVIVMDELGTLESAAPGFQRAVKSALKGSATVVACVQTYDAPFLTELLSRTDYALIELTEQNRDEQLDRLIALLR